MTNRQAAAQETRQKLLAAGKKLIAERGLSEIAVEDITAASGVSKGTFYTYFKSKEEIACALSAEMFGSARAEAEQMSGSCAEKVALYMSIAAIGPIWMPSSPIVCKRVCCAQMRRSVPFRARSSISCTASCWRGVWGASAGCARVPRRFAARCCRIF